MPRRQPAKFARRRLAAETLEPRLVLTATIPPISDINQTLDPGSSVGRLTASNTAMIGSDLVFVAREKGSATRTSDTDLWKSDGTASGTVRIGESREDILRYTSTVLAEMGGEVYFIARERIADGPIGTLVLFKTDGTEAGTTRLGEITTSGIARPADVVVAGARVFFTITAANNQTRELWATDGTVAGTVMVDTGVATASGAITPRVTVGLANEVIYVTNGNTRLMRTDGTLAGTSEIVAGDGSSFQVRLHGVSNDRLIFSGRTADTSQQRLFAIGAGQSSAVTLQDMANSLSSSYIATEDWFYFNGRPLGSAIGSELYRTDGTAAGTTLVKDIHPDPGWSGSPSSFFATDTLVYFVANAPVTGSQVWVTDGTELGTNVVSNFTNSPSFNFYFEMVGNLGDQLLFVQDDGVHGRELWITDATGSSAHLVRDIQPGAVGSRSIDQIGVVPNFYRVDDRYVFLADDGTHGYELWTTDGTSAGTTLLIDFASGPESFWDVFDVSGSLIEFFAAPTADGLIFAADDGIHGAEPWITDGTLAGTQLLKDIYTGTRDANPQWIVEFDDRVVFAADDGISGLEFYISDTTTTTRIKDIHPGAGSSYVQTLGVLDESIVVGEDQFFFIADDGVHGAEWWRSDGTDSGTYLLADSWPGASGQTLRDATITDGILYYTARASQNDYQLWRSDGTTAGTYPLTNLQEAFFGFRPGRLTTVGSTTFFEVPNASSLSTLWKTDGTTAGTQQIHGPFTGTVNGNPVEMTSFDDKLYFQIRRGSATELWISDGVTTQLIADLSLYPGANGDFHHYEGQLYLQTGSGVLRINTDGSFTPLGSLFAAGRLTFAHGAAYQTGREAAAISGDYAMYRTDLSTGLSEMLPVFSTTNNSVVFLAQINGEVVYSNRNPLPGFFDSNYYLLDPSGQSSEVFFSRPFGGSSYTGGAFSTELFYSANGKAVFPDKHEVFGYELFAIDLPSSRSVAMTSTTIAENNAAGDLVGSLFTTGGSSGATFTYALVPGDGDEDNAAFSIVDDQVLAAQAFDFEDRSTYAVRLRSTDDQGIVVEQSLLITVTDRIEDFDFGDAPARYPVSLANNGARHAVIGPKLGMQRDFESDAIASMLGDGDDNYGVSDEDGITFTSTLVRGQTATVDVAVSDLVSGNAYLNAWIDFNGDGDWDDAGEQIFDDVSLTAPTTSLSFAVPIDAVIADATFARFRLDTSGGLSPVGPANDGEVEDYRVTINSELETVMPIGNLGDGVTAQENNTGSGFLMYSYRTIVVRYGGGGFFRRSSTHVIVVRYRVFNTGSNEAVFANNGKAADGQWEYDNNDQWLPFEPEPGDRLLAEIDFDAGTVISLEGQSGIVAGIELGYLRGDLAFQADTYAGVPNPGEFGITGTYFETANDPAVRFTAGELHQGIAAGDDNVGSGYLMYSVQDVFSRFATARPLLTASVRNSDHFIAVRRLGNQWQYDNNDGWHSFTPAEGDRLMASIDFSADTVTSLSGTLGNVAGIDSGYLGGDLSFAANRFAGGNNAGEFEVTGTEFFAPGQLIETVDGPIGALNSGIAAQDNNTGTGYLMHSQQDVFTRFTAAPPLSAGSLRNSDQLIVVRQFGGQWQYDNNDAWISFAPRSTDRLLASIDFDASTITSLAGSLSEVGGIDAGYVRGDLNFFANRFAGVVNAGEFEVTGTFFAVPPRDDTVDVAVGPINAGIGTQDNNTGTGYVMFSVENLFTRFAAAPPVNAPPYVNSDHLIAVRRFGTQWQYDNNTAWIDFQPVAGDRLLASVDFDADTMTSLQGQDTVIGGIAAGYIAGDLEFVADRFLGQFNDGEFTVTGTTFTISDQTQTIVPIGELNAGIAVTDDAAGMGFLMFSATDVFSRFSPAPFAGGGLSNASNLIAVRLVGTQWQYNNNDGWFDFTAASGDRLLATIDFSGDTITSLEGTDTVVEGIASGFISGDLVFQANRFNGANNAGEFEVLGTSFAF